MSALDIAVPFVQQKEDCKLQAYRDEAGFPTIGYGHLLTVNTHCALEKFKPITQEQADQLLRDDLGKTLIGVEAALDGHGPFTDHELAALCSLAFNIGLNAFTHSTVCRMLTTAEPPNRVQAADAFRLWNKETIGGKKIVSKGLVNRREAERVLFLSPDQGA